MKTIIGNNFGAVVIASKSAKNDLEIIISSEQKIPRSSKQITEKNFWLTGIGEIAQKTKFGRMGIVFDRKNKEAKSFCKNIAKEKILYKPSSPRSEKELKINHLETQIIKTMANEGLADSVEFRRMIRKYIRNAKNLHLDSLFFLESIFAEKKTRQIIAKMAGTQIKTYFITDFIAKSREISSENSKKIFTIKTDDDLAFTKKRAEKILQKKLKKDNIQNI